MVSPTGSSSGAVARRDGNARAGWCVVVALGSVATMPLAILGTRYSSAYRLLDAAYAIPLGALLGIGALALARSARARNERALGRLGGVRAIRWGKALAVLGLCLAATGLVSIAVYGLLQYLGSRN